MIEECQNNRFTYKKTKAFWDNFNKLACEYSFESISYHAVIRDKMLFLLSYSYGIRIEEVIKLFLSDFNFTTLTHESYGSVYIKGFNTRLIYPIFHETTAEVRTYIDTISSGLKFFDQNIFTTTKGNELSIHYINNRLRFYNSKLQLNQRIDSLNCFRQFYIADILRIKGISQSFINNQIGNNISNNQVYLHLQPSKTYTGGYYV